MQSKKHFIPVITNEPFHLKPKVPPADVSTVPPSENKDDIDVVTPEAKLIVLQQEFVFLPLIYYLLLFLLSIFFSFMLS